MTTAQRARPASIWAAPTASAERKPVHAEPTSNAPARVAPSPWATSGAAAGITSSAVEVATITRSTSAGSVPARASAIRAASVAWVCSRSPGSARRREWIPVRRAIQSAGTPSRASISALATTRSGTLMPTEAATTPGRPSGGGGTSVSG